VLHYDVCGVSKVCYEVLLQRKLSVHFLLDVDGTLYQALDLADRAWHATKSNPRSIGVEIANLGAFPTGKGQILDQWYAQDADGPLLKPPARIGDPELRTSGFVARPARWQKIVGEIQREQLEQYDFTIEQYAALEKLAAALCRIFPRIQPDAPRDMEGALAREVLSDDDFAAFRGILGHYHVQQNKTDPGPAFDWEPFLVRVRAELTGAKP
jgi:N-acetyl-anhydromuramyl-L-alanine amidase AmpD